jgi:hypothetical protein
MKTFSATGRARMAVSAMTTSFRMPYDDGITDALVIDPSSSPAIVAPFSTSESA